MPENLPRRAAVLAILTVPVLVIVGTGALRLIARLPPEHASQAESLVALVSGDGAGLVGGTWRGFASVTAFGVTLP
jgi:hypothetical protein